MHTILCLLTIISPSVHCSHREYKSVKALNVLHNIKGFASKVRSVTFNALILLVGKKGKNVDLYSVYHVLHTSNALLSLN